MVRSYVLLTEFIDLGLVSTNKGLLPGGHMNLLQANPGETYIIRGIETDDEEMDAFLFSLGCYAGQAITVISHLKGGCIVSIKDGRYTIDNQLAEAITI